MIKFFKKLLNMEPVETPQEDSLEDEVLFQESVPEYVAKAVGGDVLKIPKFTTYEPNWHRIRNFQQLKELFMLLNLTFIVEEDSDDMEKFERLVKKGLLKEKDNEEGK